MAEPPKETAAIGVPLAEPSVEQPSIPRSEHPLDSIEKDTKTDDSTVARDSQDTDGEGGAQVDIEATSSGDPRPFAESSLTEDQWKSMMEVVMAIYDYREEDGHDPSRLFHRSVNKRYVPDYYDVIKEPMALSILKQRINKRDYKKYSEFVRDCALACSFL